MEIEELLIKRDFNNATKKLKNEKSFSQLTTMDKELIGKLLEESLVSKKYTLLSIALIIILYHRKRIIDERFYPLFEIHIKDRHIALNFYKNYNFLEFVMNDEKCISMMINIPRFELITFADKEVPSWVKGEVTIRKYNDINIYGNQFINYIKDKNLYFYKFHIEFRDPKIRKIIRTVALCLKNKKVRVYYRFFKFIFHMLR